VVTGPQAGHVWHDQRADRLGWATSNTRFAEWYLDWLEDEIARAPDESLRRDP
jgi:hypothetical protein